MLFYSWFTVYEAGSELNHHFISSTQSPDFVRLSVRLFRVHKAFKSVFSPATHASLPDMGPSPFPPMNKFKITFPGILKQLRNIKINKAHGQNCTKNLT